MIGKHANAFRCLLNLILPSIRLKVSKGPNPKPRKTFA